MMVVTDGYKKNQPAITMWQVDSLLSAAETDLLLAICSSDVG